MPACGEAGKPISATVQVNGANGRPIPGAEVVVGTGLGTTTNNSGRATISANCGQAGTNVAIEVRINGVQCATANINCYNRDKSGDFVIPITKVANLGNSTIEKRDLLASATELTYAGITFAGPEADVFKMTTTTSKLEDGSLMVAINSYYAEYPGFELVGLEVGRTVTKLIPNPANYLVINEESGEVYGYMQTTVQNSLFTRPQERHMQITGSIDGDLLVLDVAGFLIAPDSSDAIRFIDASRSDIGKVGRQ